MVRRLVLTALGWALVLLVLGAMSLTALFRQTVLSDLEDRLTGVADALIAHVEVSGALNLRLDEDLIDPRFSQTFSGRYWQVSLPGASDVEPLRSQSLADASLSAPDKALGEALSTPGRPVSSMTKGPDGEPLRLVIRAILIEGVEQPLLVIAGEDQRPANARILRFGLASAGLFFLFTIALAVGVFVQVRVGLAPVLRMGRAVADVRDGRADRVSGVYPAELITLGGELNKLLDHSQEVVERARTHVGNLAHALKTPLTVLSNEARDQEGPLARQVDRQTRLMSEQVEHHLRRARAAAHARTIGARAPVDRTLDDLGRTLQKIYGRQGITLNWSCEGRIVFRGEKQDLEELLGNLIDNACKWAASAVTVSASLRDGQLYLCVEDDGPGLTPEQSQAVLARGVRLDEQAPGTGLGLAIVVDLARAYEGALELDRSGLGGLKACLWLPALVES
ncbi:MAG: ATP-binding protein [Oceanicaulis sp.]|jgi:signal transduction histidine kinase|uniref:sensor histidine kinase n=1 Tax=unclassified Oceanicaulis TaxID=2632123 RepID=UPI000C55B641|nr:MULTISPECIES: sensor histidine kinase [unclassified Oceanicaulis]MAB70154.1 ATP-binding protein [Oceanicaulis sp.]MBC39341.1 ATP-binding protein [Oceanicaulis sp.]MBG35174.1 ATP-binding protein [Oceanicaulis sp.]HBU62133.1 ATP-binding protein [Oceanicaulis sp.]|tara:strand:+ start:2983 stop:4338 length:1356 start_codon:yes stop_codon:yes gene_type:complete